MSSQEWWATKYHHIMGLKSSPHFFHHIYIYMASGIYYPFSIHSVVKKKTKQWEYLMKNGDKKLVTVVQCQWVRLLYLSTRCHRLLSLHDHAVKLSERLFWLSLGIVRGECSGVLERVERSLEAGGRGLNELYGQHFSNMERPNHGYLKYYSKERGRRPLAPKK